MEQLELAQVVEQLELAQAEEQLGLAQAVEQLGLAQAEEQLGVLLLPFSAHIRSEDTSLTCRSRSDYI